MARGHVRVSGAAAIVLLVTLALAACGEDDGADGNGDVGTGDGGGVIGLLEQARADGVLTIGIANEVPYGYENEAGEVRRTSTRPRISPWRT